jgi:hypothetical protein
MAPFAGYTDFADCLAKNKDKADPEAYCGKVKAQTEGNHASVDIDNVPIFTTGTFTDSSGKTKSWGITELQTMVSAFKSKVLKAVPIKFGHSTDEFNDLVADELGIPKSTLLGESGQGMARLGEISDLKLSGSSLIATLKLANEKVHNLIKQGFFNSVSPEIKLTDKGPILGAISFLGGQRPAVPSNNNVLAKALLDDGSVADIVYKFDLYDGAMQPKFLVTVGIHEPGGYYHNIGLEGSNKDDVMKKILKAMKLMDSGESNSNGEAYSMENSKVVTVDIKPIATALKLSETAGVSDIVAAIGKLSETTSKYAESESQIKALSGQVVALTEKLELAEFSNMMATLKHLPGKVEDRVKKLQEISTKAGRESAMALFSAWEEADKAIGASNITKVSLSSQGGLTDGEASFLKAVTKAQEERKISYSEAFTVVGREHPELYNSYREANSPKK